MVENFEQPIIFLKNQLNGNLRLSVFIVSISNKANDFLFEKERDRHQSGQNIEKEEIQFGRIATAC